MRNVQCAACWIRKSSDKARCAKCLEIIAAKKAAK